MAQTERNGWHNSTETGGIVYSETVALLMRRMHELITLDGEKYLVNPGDLPTCCTWTPTAELEINTSKGYIKNLECDVVIELI